jgi:hypothetical protein
MPVRNRLVWRSAALLVALAAPAVYGVPRDRDVLARAGERVLQYQANLPHLIATEISEQRATAPRGYLIEVAQRRLVAELGWVSAGAAPDVVGVRDVVEVDGQPLRDVERSRLQMLLHGNAPTSIDDATRLLNEGARYNLAEGSRNFNLPTVALFFLHPETQPRFKWSRKSPTSAPVWDFEFKERERPTIIRTGDGVAVFSRGTVQIDVRTGEILRTTLIVHIDKLDYTLVTEFAPVKAMGMTLPVRLEERYVTPSGTITGEATYDKYRRFETSARLVQ